MRFKTREVLVGSIGIGGNNPIRIQSMITKDTRDIKGALDQILELRDAGCDIVRLTVQGKKEAECTQVIKNELVRMGVDIPLVADIHFYPKAALLVSDFVEKIRINPGNFADNRAIFKKIEYSEKDYEMELEKIEATFFPLIEKCKKNKVALRIGANHGSLSDRIMNRYGDTPIGMVESAFEYARICRKYDFHNFVFSMKASNPIVMVEAYKTLVIEMIENGWDYPVHLGVTEAGEGEDGRIKSAIGIGSLLLDGIGDTIRVSLTEDPVNEIDPCKRIIKYAEKNMTFRVPKPADFFEKRNVVTPKNLGLVDRGSVIHNKLDALANGAIVVYGDRENTWYEVVKKNPPFIILENWTSTFFDWLKHNQLTQPVILSKKYNLDKEDLVIAASMDFGSYFSRGFGEGILIESKEKNENFELSILQACRMRSFKTDFIACPGCGRTLFDLQEVTKRIKEKTGHLAGVKIAIMGCIVNGPGEMADADFGYVGSKPGKIDLYVGKTVVERGIDFKDADTKLIDLIKSHGKWTEPDVV
jgi:(E)-4-hydroxy-3-methylbut-2-enyl-diphosphate synthase